MATSASKRPLCAIHCRVTGISRAPGTETTDDWAPSFFASCSARSSSRLASAWLNRLATMPRRMASTARGGRAAHVAGHFETEARHARHLARRGHEAHAADAEVAQDLRADAVDAQVDAAPGARPRLFPTVGEPRLERLRALRAVEQHHRARTRLANRGERLADAPGVRAGAGIQQIDERERLMNAHQRFLVAR